MIYRYDFRYALAKIPVNTALRLNFRKLVFVGMKENVSKKRAIIFAPNHRNALIDALILVFASYHRKQIVFLARADIFKKSFMAWLLRGMRIMPVFRIRDGKDNLDKNNEIFNNAARILRKNNPIALFPEAKHNPKQSLLPIQKAVPRIVLPTEASVDFQLRSQIVPVSIYYRDMFGFLSDVYVTFGTPIEVSGYKDMYNENSVLAINQLRQELENRLKSMVVNIWNDEFYNEYSHAIDWNGDRIAREKFSGRKDDFLQAALYIVKKLDELYENNRVAFDQKTAGFREACILLKKHGFTSKDRLGNPSSVWNLFTRFTALILSAPIAFFGFLNGIFPILINKKLSSLFKDKQFIPSARYASGLFFVPIFDLIQSLIVGAVTKNWLLALGYFILMPLTFYFALYWRKWFKTGRRDCKVRRFAKQHPNTWKRVLELIRL
ncbi:1-acyl-sn-glycerol-3-phosphate acyltransferase [Proteiniphilum acetatigenes]|uniref:LpxL/LpxP family acyltransferase n=1 Tax=Proteiniphilum acetatigenes TaxID=294710 RepID=UPI0003752CA9|nr:1-acyl-sn-glycerol-3-phosphate acyltransferase [Proteiniphilum acetatigenes]SFK60046.1 1-acyl-sn-glycerol-3-phosphate acyltransferase [Porphyromonadaceae bacterium KH3CP3RA]